MQVITRFAPSPTGFLHIGNIRTALIAWLYARANRGKFILRIDDTDKARSEDRYITAIKEDLLWLGLEWDDCFKQSSRTDRYHEMKAKFISQRRLYPCYESQEELALRKKILLSAGPPIYNRAALKLSSEDMEELEKSGLKPHWRFFLLPGKIEWDDLVRGLISFDAHDLSDPVCIRQDGSLMYLFASAIDDFDYNTTHIIRGADHISNSAVQWQMFHLLGRGTVPLFGHISLIQSKTGEISKRLGGFSIRDLRDSGAQPMAILSLLATIGTSGPTALYSSLDELTKAFHINKMGHSQVSYDEADIFRLNSKILHQMQYSDFQKIQPHSKITQKAWNVIRENVEDFKQISMWEEILSSNFKINFEKPVEDDVRRVLSAAYNALPYDLQDEVTWNNWLTKIRDESGISGKKLFSILRLAITGSDHGPYMKDLLNILDREVILQRLHDALHKE